MFHMLTRKEQASYREKLKCDHKLAAQAFADLKKVLEKKADNRSQRESRPHASTGQNGAHGKVSVLCYGGAIDKPEVVIAHGCRVLEKIEWICGGTPVRNMFSAQLLLCAWSNNVRLI